MNKPNTMSLKSLPVRYFSIASVITCLLFSSTANANIFNIAKEDIKPYGGVDLHIRPQKFKRGFGDNLFKTDFGQGNFFLGLFLNEYLGLEVGYQTTSKRTRDAVVETGDSYLGAISPVPLGISSSAKIRNFNANVVGLWPIYKENGVSLMGTIGLARIKTELQTIPVTVAGVPHTGDIINLKGSKYALRMGGGLMYSLSDSVAIRALCIWEQTSIITAEGIRSNGSGAHAKLKDSISYGLGIVLTLA